MDFSARNRQFDLFVLKKQVYANAEMFRRI